MAVWRRGSGVGLLIMCVLSMQGERHGSVITHVLLLRSLQVLGCKAVSQMSWVTSLRHLASLLR